MCGCRKHFDETADCDCVCPEHRNFDAAYALAMSHYDAAKNNRDVVLAAIRSLMLSDNLGDVHEEVDRLRAAVGLAPLAGNYLSGWEPVDWEGIGTDE